MLVKNWMTTDVVTVEAGAPLETAAHLLRGRGFEALPVLRNRRLVGMISETDMLRCSETPGDRSHGPGSSGVIDRRKVSDCMTACSMTFNTDHTVEEAADRLLQSNVSRAPVIDQHQRLVGIFARADTLRALVSVTGAARQGIHLAFEVEDRPGSIEQLTDTIRRYGGRIASLLTTITGAARGCRRAYVRMFGIDRFKLPSLIKEFRKTEKLIYVVDRKEICVKNGCAQSA